ncbi:MAG: type II toxin-antitoxin system HicA family toxin [Candidatus Micrarchaeota archaeon]|nr:type II toxin-antitoxin system HicA family toxin [Candidatus Micrarchaeota archaeon]
MPKYRHNGNSRLVISGKEMVSVLDSLGYDVVRVKGDHLIMKERNGPHLTQVEIGGRSRELGQHNLSEILRQTDLTKDKIIWALKKQ